MLAGSMINPLETSRYFVTLNASFSSQDSSRGNMVSSTIWIKSFNSKKSPYKLRTSPGRESWLTVRASAEADQGKIHAQADAKGHRKLLTVCENILQRVADWKKAETYEKSGQIYEGKVDRSNKGGLLVRFHSLQGFLPYSQMNFARDGSKTMEEFVNGLIGSTVSVKIIDVNEAEKQLTFSQKLVAWENFVDQVNVGDVFEGRVKSLAEFGAFVNLRFPDGGYHLEGLVHISEISWDEVHDIKDFMKEGENIRAKVLRIDKEKFRIGLSIKQLQADPYSRRRIH